ncbi:hypothetical protein ACFL0V_00700 [Nanoarchaeota archaeon]
MKIFSQKKAHHEFGFMLYVALAAAFGFFTLLVRKLVRKIKD